MNMRENARRALEAWYVKADLHGDYSGGVDAVLDAIREPSECVKAQAATALATAYDTECGYHEPVLAMRAYQAAIDSIKRGEG